MGDLTDIVSLLGPLQYNGGPTETHALLPGSPAIDAGNPAGCTDQAGNPLTTDQRGVVRPQGTACDIGAFELEAAISVSIDIKPGGDPNAINCNNQNEAIAVAILTGEELDATTVDHTKVAFEGASYRFTFTPLECKDPDKTSSFAGKRRSHSEQARYQMGRIAVHFVKAILTAAEAHPHALFGFIELPEAGMHPGGLPVTAGELDVSGLTSALPPLEIGSPVHLLPGGRG